MVRDASCRNDCEEGLLHVRFQDSVQGFEDCGCGILADRGVVKCWSEGVGHEDWFAADSTDDDINDAIFQRLVEEDFGDTLWVFDVSGYDFEVLLYEGIWYVAEGEEARELRFCADDC